MEIARQKPRRPGDVDEPEALVAPVASEATNRLAPSPEKDEAPEPRHESE